MSPLPVARLEVDGLAGALLLHPCPGIAGRRLAADLAALRAMGATAMLTLLPAGELTMLNLGRGALREACAADGIDWRHMPIDDMGVPDLSFAAGWPDAVAWINVHLTRGDNVAIHCRAGLGRTGTVAARFLVEQGIVPGAAISTVRAARPGAIETPGQVQWVAGAGWPRA